MENLDNVTPGGVYLCQVNEHISCGACCGLYNVSDPSYENLNALLQFRTDLYEKTERTYDALLEFQRIIEAKEHQERPYAEFHHCPYIGFIGENKQRPGCLLHPLGKGNKGIDHRGLSHWGGFACATYFCPTCSELEGRYKKILRICAGDWHLFGMVVTETEMLKAYFTLLEKKCGKEVSPEKFNNNPKLQDSVIRFFTLKTTWPYRNTGFNRLGNYFFKDNLYPREPINYQKINTKPSELDSIFMALGSEFHSADELKKAEAIIADLINETVGLLS